MREGQLSHTSIPLIRDSSNVKASKVHSELRSITTCGNQSARDSTEFGSVNMGE